jgi:hypothetical protein
MVTSHICRRWRLRCPFRADAPGCAVRLAHVRGGVSGHPDHRLGYRLDLQQVERKVAPLMDEACAHDAIGIVEIDGRGAKAGDGLPFGQAVEGDRRGLGEGGADHGDGEEVSVKHASHRLS